MLRAELADDADFRFDVALGATKDELLFGGKLVMGNDAGAVEAEENGVGGLGENLPSRSLPIRRMGICLGMRLLLRTTCCGTQAAKKGVGGSIWYQLRERELWTLASVSIWNEQRQKKQRGAPAAAGCPTRK